MPSLKYEVITEYLIWGEEGASIKVKPGDQICFIGQKMLHPEKVKEQKLIIAKHGKGPFNLLEIRRRFTKVIFSFIDDYGKKAEVAPTYFDKVK